MIMTLMIIHIICSQSRADDDNVGHDDCSAAADDDNCWKKNWKTIQRLDDVAETSL